MVGDVDYDSVAPRVRALTPVPGGVGPVTDVWLLRNTVLAARILSGMTAEEATRSSDRPDSPIPPGGVMTPRPAPSRASSSCPAPTHRASCTR